MSMVLFTSPDSEGHSAGLDIFPRTLAQRLTAVSKGWEFCSVVHSSLLIGDESTLFYYTVAERPAGNLVARASATAARET